MKQIHLQYSTVHRFSLDLCRLKTQQMENPNRERESVPMSNFLAIWSDIQELGGENRPSWTSSIYNTKAVCTGGLGMNKYSVTYSFVLQVLMQVIQLIIPCSVKETNLDEKKMNSKSIIANTLQISWRVVTSPRTV